MKRIALYLLLPLFLTAQSPAYIQKEIDRDTRQFQKAKEMFNPWYSGPLLTGSANMMPAGNIGIQPYIFVADNYGVYKKNRSVKNIDDLVQLNPQINGIQFGLTSWMDAAVSIQTFVNWQNGHTSGALGDTNLTVGFPIYKETLWVPGMKIGVGAIFPTGRYQNATGGKALTQITGEGSWQPQFSYRISKLLFWDTLHPFNLRATFTYTIPTNVTVKGFNAYGGGYGTCGEVRPGNNWDLSIGAEWSFSQNWVLANDFVYLYNYRSKFSGYKGVDKNGNPAKVGIPSGDQFSLCPAIEYNPTPRLGFLSGLWFTVTGKNTFAFVQGIVTVTYTWNVR